MAWGDSGMQWEVLKLAAAPDEGWHLTTGTVDLGPESRADSHPGAAGA